MVFEETKKCIDSILSNVEGEKKLIVVDNCSPNNSAKRLKNIYLGNSEVVFLFNENNFGYASGINEGYKFCIDNFNSDFIVCMNNDMEILQKDFIRNIYKSYRNTGFFVMGPDVFSTSTMRHQNPNNDSIRTVDDIDRHIAQIEKLQKERVKLRIKSKLKSISAINTIYYTIKNVAGNNNVNHIMKNVTLNGSCIIFSREYMDVRSYAFKPITKFYCEPQILDYECLRNKYLTIYDPSVKIIHHEDVSSDAAFGSYEEKMIKKYALVKESLLAFKAEMKRDV